MNKTTHHLKKVGLGFLLGTSFLAQAQTIFVSKDDLYIKSGNVLTVSSRYQPADSARWRYSAYDEQLRQWVDFNATGNSITLTAQAVVELKVYTATGNYIKTVFKEMPYDTPQPGSDRLHALANSSVVQISGLEVRAIRSLHADSTVWKVRNDLTRDSAFYSYAAPLSDSAITVFQNATVTAWVKSQGLWYTQTIRYNGLSQDAVSGILQAPLVAEATYTWYCNGQLLSSTTASCTPTQLGTYKVVVEWPSTSFPNQRVMSNSAEFVFEVTSLPVATSLLAQKSSDASILVFPNPALDHLTISQSGTGFRYSIESMEGVQVASGSGIATAELSVGHLSKGLYRVRIQSDGTETTKRLIVR